MEPFDFIRLPCRGSIFRLQMKKLITIILAALCLNSCEWLGLGPEKEDNSYTVLFYVAGDNSISSYARDNIYGDTASEVKGLVDGYLPLSTDKDNNLVVFYDTGDNEGPKLVRFHKGKDGTPYEQLLKRYPADCNSAKVETLTEVLNDVESVFPSKRKGLILWSHGSGYLPEGYYSNPKDKANLVLKSFAEEGNVEMDITELHSALSHYHYDYILFDCCLMGGVEVAYEFRDCADYIAFSPTEILAEGFRYDLITDRLFNISDTRLAVETICRDYMNLYLSKSGSERCATISMVKSCEMENLAAACRQIFENHRSQLNAIDRTSIQRYGRNHASDWYFDLDDFIDDIASPEEYAVFSEALSKAVIFKSTTPSFLSITISHFSGLSIYIPRSKNTVLNTFYKQLSWNKATGLVE